MNSAVDRNVAVSHVFFFRKCILDCIKLFVALGYVHVVTKEHVHQKY